jgi:hypothetical protein
MLFGVAGAQAAMVNFTIDGIVDSAFGSPFGLVNGSTITASGTFDDSVISSSPYTVYFNSSNLGNTMTIVAGSLPLDQTQEDSYGPLDGAELVFDSSADFKGIDFHKGFPDFSAFDSFTGIPSSTFAINDSDFNEVDGHWIANTFSMTPVPVPAAVWLFGSGLLGLAGVARRKKT